MLFRRYIHWKRESDISEERLTYRSSLGWKAPDTDIGEARTAKTFTVPAMDPEDYYGRVRVAGRGNGPGVAGILKQPFRDNEARKWLTATCAETALAAP